MMDTELIITVERETETRLERRWITVLSVDGIELYTRRSVILGRGVNKIILVWKCGKDGTVDSAVIFETATSKEILRSARIRGSPLFIKIAPGDTTTLVWSFIT